MLKLRDTFNTHIYIYIYIVEPLSVFSQQLHTLLNHFILVLHRLKTNTYILLCMYRPNHFLSLLKAM